MAHGRHHGKGQHDQRDMPVPAVPGPGLAVSKPQLGFGRLKCVLNGLITNDKFCLTRMALDRMLGSGGEWA